MTQQTFSQRFLKAVACFKDKTRLLREIAILEETDLRQLAIAWREVTGGSGEFEKAFREMSQADRDALEPYVVELHNAITQQLAANGSSEETGLIFTRDSALKGGLFYLQPPEDLGGPRSLTGVYLENIPTDHWLRGIFDDSNCCGTNRGPGIILGSRTRTTLGGWENRHFHLVERARHFTREIRDHQQASRLVARQNEVLEQQRAKREWEQSPAGMQARIRQLEQQLASLPAAGNQPIV